MTIDHLISIYALLMLSFTAMLLAVPMYDSSLIDIQKTDSKNPSKLPSINVNIIFVPVIREPESEQVKEAMPDYKQLTTR